MLFVVVDSGRGPQGDWAQTLEGPTGKDLVGAVIDTIIDANTRSSYAAFDATMSNWRQELIKWRCGLGGPWNCRDLKFTVTRVAFDQLDAARAKRLNAVPTSFTLPPATVDEVILAGRDALKANTAFQAFLKDR